MPEASRGREAQGTGAWHGVGGRWKGLSSETRKNLFFFPPVTAKKDAVVAGKSLSEGRGRTQAVYAQEPTDSQGEAIYSERQQPAG